MLKNNLGFVAAEFDSPLNPLSSKTDELPLPSFQDIESLFTRSMKRGKFLRPSNEWLRECIEIEKDFHKHHLKHGIKKGTGLEKEFLATLSEKFPHRPQKMLKRIAQLRTDYRLRKINLIVKLRMKKKASKRARRKRADY